MKNNPISLPTKVVFCKICVQSNQRPRTTVEFKKKNISIKSLSFNDDDICDACKYHYEIKEKIDRTIIGGFIIKMGDSQYDTSVRKKLKNVKRAFQL